MYDDSQTVPAPPPLEPPRPQRNRTGMSRRTAMSLMAAGLISGGFAGGYVISQAATASTATPSPSSSSSGSPSSGSSGSSSATGAFHSNENATHEAGESAQREAQENAGQMPTVP